MEYKTIEVDLDDETFMFIAEQAHKRDITFNKMVQSILDEEIERKEDELIVLRFDKIIKEVQSWNG